MEELSKRFSALFPDKFFLSYAQDKLADYLVQRDWLEKGEQIESVEKPGEGNMNFVLRVITNQRSFIIKQARPWVEKYPHIEAPVERNSIEARYYLSVNRHEVLKEYSPHLLGLDEDNYILVMSDLGRGTDYAFLYETGEEIAAQELDSLLEYLIHLHRLPIRDFPANKAMRSLNHEHIFNFPFEENNGFDLDDIQPGLQAISLPYKRDSGLKSKIKSLGEVYLGEGSVLIHGDFYPGSWLKARSGPKIIDPEFSFKGRVEFDLGVLVAHLVLSRQATKLVERAIITYRASQHVEENLLAGFAGTEILRRLMGVAQLPLPLTKADKGELMALAASWVQHDKIQFI